MGYASDFLWLFKPIDWNINTGRPQRDGPPLRATTFILYANWLIDNGNTSWVADNLWPIIKLDLDYVENFWNRTTYVSIYNLIPVTDLAQCRFVGGSPLHFLLHYRRSTQGIEARRLPRSQAWPLQRRSWLC